MADGGHKCSCEHDHAEGPERGFQYSLYRKIDTEKVQCLNEAVEGSGKVVFKAWEDRMSSDKFVESDADEELLFNIPFTGNVKLKGIVVIGGEQQQHPSKLKLYKNRPRMSFDNVGSVADQEFDMHPDPNGVLEYQTKIARFNSVSHLSMYFPSNFGAENTKVYYIGLRGEYTEAQREELMIVNYELRPNPADHKTNNITHASHQIH